MSDQAPDLIADRDPNRRTHMESGVRYYLTAEEETARDAKEATWEAEKPARAFIDLRTRRNELLHDTDFYSLSDVTMSDDMKTYRQALRDLPATLDNSSVLSFDMASGFPAKP